MARADESKKGKERAVPPDARSSEDSRQPPAGDMIIKVSHLRRLAQTICLFGFRWVFAFQPVSVCVYVCCFIFNGHV